MGEKLGVYKLICFENGKRITEKLKLEEKPSGWFYPKNLTDAIAVALANEAIERAQAVEIYYDGKYVKTESYRQRVNNDVAAAMDDCIYFAQLYEKAHTSSSSYSSSSNSFSSSSEEKSSSSENSSSSEPPSSSSLSSSSEENLKYDLKYVNKSKNAENTDSSSFNTCGGRGKDSCDYYGRLYTWAGAIDSIGLYEETGKICGFETDTAGCSFENRKGVRPEGWHLPSLAEWKALLSTIGGFDGAGKKNEKRIRLGIQGQNL